MLHASKFICLIIAALLVSERSAYAYLDAGTGSMILQAILAGVAGAVVLVKVFWQRFVAFFSKDKTPKNKE